MGSGKGDEGSDNSSTTTATAGASDEMTQIMSMFGAMMMQQQQLQQQQMLSQYSITMPDVGEYNAVDWTEKNNELASKALADYTLQRDLQKTAIDTIHTSPLLGDETTTSINLLG